MKPKILTISGFATKPDSLNTYLDLNADYLDYINIRDEEIYNINYKNYNLLIGWSLGGHVALKLAQKNNIKNIILISTPYNFICENNGINSTNYQIFLNNMLYNKKKTLEKFEQFINFGSKNKIRCINYNYKTEDLIYWLKKLQETATINLDIETKITLISASNDFLIYKDHIKNFATRFKNAKLYEIKNSNHAAFINQKKFFNKIINDFSF
jgi:homoserine acetyltransferase